MGYGDDRESISRNIQGFLRLRFRTDTIMSPELHWSKEVIIKQALIQDLGNRFCCFNERTVNPGLNLGFGEEGVVKQGPFLHPQSLASLVYTLSLWLFCRNEWQFSEYVQLFALLFGLAPAIPPARTSPPPAPGLGPMHASLSFMIRLFSDLFALPPL